jgi:hypothetical protein
MSSGSVSVPQRHQLHPPRLERIELAVDEFRLGAHAHHARGGGTIDIGVEQPGPQAKPRESAGEVGGHRRLSHPTLAAGHGDDPMDVGEPLAGRHPASVGLGVGRYRSAAAHARHTGRRGGRGGGEHDLRLLNTADPQQRLLGGVPHRRIERGLGRGHFQHEAHPALAEAQRLDQAGRSEPLSALGVLHPIEGGEDGGA